MTKPVLMPADFIETLNMNGMQGRMLRMPAPKNRKREILFIYGHHSSLERWFGFAQVLNRYGAVTMPDLPGFGGMESFYKISKKPTIDNMADYLAAFVKMRYKNRRVTLIGMSFGFVVLTRMLQRCPDLVKKVDILVSVVGFAHHDDFLFSKARFYTYYYGARFFALPGAANFFREVCLHPAILRTAYGKTHNAKQKFADLSPQQHADMMDIEIDLWRNNDVRTYMFTTTQMLRLDNCQKQIDLPLYHVETKGDHFFDNAIIEQHMHVIFKEFNSMSVSITKHAPTVMATAKDAAPFIPPKLRKILAEK